MGVERGSRLGIYEVVAAIGAGGMGEVYRATDTKLGREVAIKVLPAEVAQDPERMARFEREAKLLASLNHPNIAHVYGFESTTLESGAPVHLLVMELVEGEDLAARLKRGAISVDEAIAIAKQIALGLEEAHDRNIVHRDLKPANVKVTPSGKVKVLDFGLAKVFASNGSSTGLEPTRSVEMTGEGVVYGTAAYMSPEQALGQALDARSDLWAFGCVLFEMLTGTRAFPGATISDVIAAILTREPDWALLPKRLPAGVTRVIRRCLKRDPGERLRHAADARLDLQEAAQAGPEASAVVARSFLPLGVAIALGLAAGIAWIGLAGRDSASDAVAVRASIVLPAGQALETGTLSFAVSPDGRTLVYSARRDGVVRLYARPLDAFRAEELPGTEGARFPVVSPTGADVAFLADGKLKRVPMSGGAAVDICDAPSTGRARGASWGDDGTIVFGVQDGKLARVDARGGTPRELETPPEEGKRLLLDWPEFLPGSRFLLATVRPERAGGEQSRIGVYSFETRTWRFAGPGEQPRFMRPGWLLFHAPHVREGDLQVIPFDPTRGVATGEPRIVIERLYRGPGAGGLFFSVSQAGQLVYARGGLDHALVKVDRSGKRTRLSEELRGFRFPAVSPDGRRVAVTIDPRPSQIWVYDIERGARVRISGAGHSIGSVWSPDGLRLAYSAQGATVVARADGSGDPQQVSSLDYPTSWARDGSLIIAVATEHGPDIYAVGADGRDRPLVTTPFRENEGKVSPDARWFAYSSDESGRREVYVRPYPDASAGKWIASTGGGRSPVWSPDGSELFFMSESAVMAVRIQSRAGRLTIDPPRRLFDGPFDTTQDNNFDVFPDGSGFVMVEVDPDARPTRLSLVTHWARELSRNAGIPPGK